MLPAWCYFLMWLSGTAGILAMGRPAHPRGGTSPTTIALFLFWISFAIYVAVEVGGGTSWPREGRIVVV